MTAFQMKFISQMLMFFVVTSSGFAQVKTTTPADQYSILNLEKIYKRQTYNIQSVAKSILADNKDEYIVPTDPKNSKPTGDFFVTLYFKDNRNGACVIIDANEVFKSMKTLSVQKTINSITERGIETCFLCEDIKNKDWYRLTRIENEGKTSFNLEFEYNKDRKNFMQLFLLIPATSIITHDPLQKE